MEHFELIRQLAGQWNAFSVFLQKYGMYLTAAALVFDRGDGQDFDIGEPVAFGGGLFGRLCRGSSCETEREYGENEVFHGMTGFCCPYFFDPATIFRHSSRVSSSGLAPFGRR